MDKILSLISLATKAGKTASGEFAAEKAIRDGKAYLVIIAEDASGNTNKKFRNMGTYRDIPVKEYGTKEMLGMVCGKDYRSVVVVCDKGFGDNINRLLTEVEI